MNDLRETVADALVLHKEVVRHFNHDAVVIKVEPRLVDAVSSFHNLHERTCSIELIELNLCVPPCQR